MVKICGRTLERLGEHVTGDGGMTPYRSGPDLIKLFREYGADDVYGKGFPSRWAYAEENLRRINNSSQLADLIETVFDPLNFEGTEFDPQAATDDINKYLERDLLRLTVRGGKAKLLSLEGQSVCFTVPPTVHPSSIEFIRDNVEKCERKLSEGDYRGAITNARSLCEDVMIDIERQLDPAPPKSDGNLAKLFKRVRGHLKMKAKGHAAESVTQLLRGLESVVSGMAGLSNSLGDRHGGGDAQPKRHHAEPAVNAANTLCTFLSASFSHQQTAHHG